MKMRSQPTAAGRPADEFQSIIGKKCRPSRFLRPIPIVWIAAAAKLPGRSLHAGIALWCAARMARSTTVSLSNVSGLHFGLDRNAKYRALQWLEGAGLITVERKLGRAPIVTLLIPASPP